MWQARLPPQVELFNLVEDSAEKTSFAGKNLQNAAELQQRIEALVVQPLLFGSVALPGEEQAVEKQP